MNPFKFPFALMGFLGFVLVVPAWIWFIQEYGPAAQLTTEGQFLATLILPGTVILFLVSWLQPRGA